MEFNQFLKRFELTLISTLSEFYQGKKDEKFLELVHELTMFKYNSNMTNLLCLRALERIVNGESEF